jgi:uncharacterized protein (TIGR04255 family)
VALCSIADKSLSSRQDAGLLVVKKYESPPIEEAVCEFRFSESSSWDQTYPGLIYSEIREDFPEKRETTAYGIGRVSGGDEPRIESQGRTRFYREDENALIQVGSHVLAANRLKPYDSWEEFSEVIKAGYEAYEKVVEPRGLQRISLRYINKVHVEPNSELEEYFSLGIRTEGDLPDQFVAFIAGMVSYFQDGRDTLKIQLTNSDSDQEDMIGIMLELEYVLVDATKIDLDEVNSWLETAHSKIEENFEASIKEPLREQFGEIKS